MRDNLYHCVLRVVLKSWWSLACWKYTQWMHSCWAVPPKSLVRKDTCFQLEVNNSDQSGVVHHEVLSPHIAQSPSPQPLPKPLRKEKCINKYKKMFSHGLSLIELMILWFCLSVFWTAVWLKVWYLTTSMWQPRI